MSKPIRILLVDDSPYFLEAACDFLYLYKLIQVAGTATNGQDALAKARELNPDVILLDLNLGSQSGLEIIPLIKASKLNPKIIVLTIMENEPYHTAAMQAGADAFVRKTEMSRTLVSVIYGLMNVSITG